ncbi:MAG: AbrB/MazE/SpoVT family DNA-binding domain-containing protein [Candidatus Moranbacteria bacterium]|nr:AbrB/MazE/SpoVT family DNA-binding domain-containing protein [Candidatus Moranbacteria bacterium]MDD5652388.1 AbrB/MazE/SpoVT family DNA-binding domain-containing protein [Candidatus Moranbacteria bacterium]MDX9855776.1 AbrB/MazE/SpoVT family DNA-binding domain-containing protein [Candidatus Moranbacteria bacterium]
MRAGNKKAVCKIKKSSAYSYSITIPKKMMDKYDWREKQKMVIEDKGGGKLEIRDWHSR